MTLACASADRARDDEAGSTVLALLSGRLAGRSGRIAVQAAVLTAVIGAGLAYAATNKSVTLSIDGRASKVHAFASSVGDLLRDQNVRVSSRDLVAPAASTSLGDGDTVVVRYARPLTITIDGRQQTFWTTALSVDEALRALGVRAEGAAMSASRSAPLGRAGLTMWLSTPKQVTLSVDGHNHPLTTTAPSVGALLLAQSVTVNPLDRLSALPSTPLADGMVIKLTRITTKRVTATEAIAFQTVSTKTSSLYKGQTKVTTPGHAGRRTVVYQLTVVNGRRQSKKLISSTVLKKPVSQVQQVGTKAKPVSSSGSGGGGGSAGGKAASLNWPALAKCESGGNPNSVNPAGYYGLYQFSVSTWHSVGGSGKPTDYGSSEQTYRAQLLFNKVGDSAWPSCGHHLYD